MAPPEKKHKRPVGAGLALDKFATLGVSKFDKRKKLERIQKQKLIKHSKYRKLKQKLEAQGILSGAPVKDAVAELEALDADGPSGSGDGSDGADGVTEREARIKSHARADTSSKAHPPAREKAPQRTQAAAAAAVHPHANRTRQGTPDVAGPVQQSRDPAASGQPANLVGRQPALADLEGSGNRKRPRGDGDDAGPHEEPGRLKARGSMKGADQASGREAEGHGDRGPGGSSGGKQWSGAGAAGGQRGGATSDGGAPDAAYDTDMRGGGKKLSRLQRLAQQVAEEKAQKQRAKEQAMKDRDERMKKVAAVEKARKEQKHLHFKRTAKGQPLMRYRMEKLLSQLQDKAQ